MKLIVNATGLAGNAVQVVLDSEDRNELNKGVMTALYRTKGLANVIDPATGHTATGPVHQIAEKARLGAFLNEFEHDR